MPSYLKWLEIQGKNSLDHETWVTVTYKKNEVTCSVKLHKYPKYDANLLDTARDI